MTLLSRAAPCGALATLAAALVAASLSIACDESSVPPEPSPRAAPARVLPVSATAVDFVCSLLGPERVVGLPEQAIDYSLLHADDPAWRGTPRFYAYEAEPVLALEPDLVVACPYQSRDTHARLRESGVEVLVLPDIANFEQARAALLAVGEALGEGAHARELAAELDRRVAGLASARAGRPPVRALCYSNFGSQGWTAGARTTIDEVLRLAGVSNVVAEAGREGHLTIAFEEVLQYDPDVVIVSAPLNSPPGSAGDRGGASRELLLGEPALAQLRAVRDRQILVLPAWLFASGSHEMVRAAEVLAEELDLLRAGAREAERR